MDGSASDIFSLTIEKIVFNEIGLFNVNFFDYSDSYTIGTKYTKTISASSTNIAFKESVAKFFILFRIIAMGLELLVLIYIGIRMALSVLPEGKARYKKMLIAWIESIIIIFALHYLMVIFYTISKVFTDMAYDLKMILDPTDRYNFEQIVIDTVTPFVEGAKGFNFISYSIVYWFATFILIKFFFTYMKRLITLGFLILISPFISVIYSIDKAGDGKAQSFRMWLTEVAINFLIQPIHAFIYLIFMLVAGEIAQYSILIALMLLVIMTKIEGFIIKIFGLSAKTLNHVKDQKVGKKNI